MGLRKAEQPAFPASPSIITIKTHNVILTIL